MEWQVIVPGTACRWITAVAPQAMRSPPACHRVLRPVLEQLTAPKPVVRHALDRVSALTEQLNEETWRWSRCRCFTRRPKSHPRARPTA